MCCIAIMISITTIIQADSVVSDENGFISFYIPFLATQGNTILKGPY